MRAAALGAGVVVLLLLASAAQAQDALSPLPPPVTRSLYRAQWFEFLSAFSENDAAAEARALEDMERAARKVGVRRLSDFSRTAVYLGRRAEKQGQPDRADRAYRAALALDDANPDAILARLSFLVRHGKVGDALRSVPESTTALFSAHESRVAILSALGTWAGAAAATTVAGIILSLAVRHAPRVLHDLREAAFRFFGRSGALPLGLVIAGLPLFVGFGPVWLLLYWGALLWAYAEDRERMVLGAGFVALALIAPLAAWVTQENIRQRSPLFVAAIDLEERREDASAEDGLRQAAAVFPEDADVWFLLGIYAERSGDLERAQAEYGRAMQADPADFRPILNRGNVHFTEGDYGEAIRDYTEASKKAPDAAEAYYNLSLARGEAYDFDGQALAIARARELSNVPRRGLVRHAHRVARRPRGFPALAGARADRRLERPAQEPAPARPRHGGHALARADLAVGPGAGRGAARRRPARAPPTAAGPGLALRALRPRLLQSLPPLRRPGAVLRDLRAVVPCARRTWTSSCRWPRRGSCRAASGAGHARAGSPRCCCRARMRSWKTAPSRAR